ncbi:MAG: hypothetical protein ABL907_19095 [Hyphomicrobium sp.]
MTAPKMTAFKMTEPIMTAGKPNPMTAMLAAVMLAGTLLAAVSCGAGTAMAGDDWPRPLRRALNYPVPSGEAVGCYWERGRQHCGKFCYWEVNGRRYCQQREERATPQGARIEDYLLDESASTLYRRPYGPLRSDRRHHRRRAAR